MTPVLPSRDPKWRFHWKVNFDRNVIPSDFPDWESTMESWGINMKNGCLTVSEMVARGLGLEEKFLYNTIVNGSFHLAPTAVDLDRTKIGDVLAAFHRDFDLLTIHGRARFPGLFAWLNTGEKFMVNVPEGHLLVQAGKQIEWMTGGEIKAGFHEVIHTNEVEEAK
jgi:isopenicillin N synthase-like dioxygenase